MGSHTTSPPGTTPKVSISLIVVLLNYQMGKQTMGVPLHAWKYRSDNKLYRITYPQTTVVRTAMYDYLDMDDYPLGTNAIVAVMSYTVRTLILIERESSSSCFYLHDLVCPDITFDMVCPDITFDMVCSDITFDMVCPDITFDMVCPDITFDMVCPDITFDMVCPDITFD